MSTPVSRPPASVPLRLAIGLIAIGLGGYGFLTILLGGALLGGIVLARLWRRSRRPHGGTGA